MNKILKIELSAVVIIRKNDFVLKDSYYLAFFIKKTVNDHEILKVTQDLNNYFSLEPVMIFHTLNDAVTGWL